MSDPGPTVTLDLLRELKKRAAEANSVYAMARQVYKQQRREERKRLKEAA